MAISAKQFGFAVRNLNSLIPDLLDFEERYNEIDFQSVRGGKFDLRTTIQAVYEAYEWQMEGARNCGLRRYDPTLKIVHNTSAEAIKKAYFKAIELIENKVLYCPNFMIKNETVTADRMRKSLYKSEVNLK